MSKRYVIYTAMVGCYDDIMQPQVIDDRFDYILFSDDTSKGSIGVWQLRSIPYHNSDNTRICRFVKTRPQELLPDYALSIWIDSNVTITSPFIYQRSIELLNAGTEIASIKHQARDCIYEEGFFIIKSLMGHEKMFMDWCHYLINKGYPRHQGLFETNVLFRIHNEAIQQVDKEWWWCIEHFSRRDQLSFNYVLWKNDKHCAYFLADNEDTRTSEHFSLKKHNNIKHNQVTLQKKEAWLLRYYWKHTDEEQSIFTCYLKLSGRPFPHFWAALYGQCYRVKHILKHYLT